MQDWTKDEWDNLERLSRQLEHLLTMPETARENRAWRTKLRLTIRAIGYYNPEPEPAHVV